MGRLWLLECLHTRSSRVRVRSRVCWGLLGLLLSCAQPNAPTNGTPAAPATPRVNDDSYTVTGVRTWYLKIDSLTRTFGTLGVRVVPPDTSARVDVWLDGSFVATLVRRDGACVGAVPLSSVACGDHRLLLSLHGADTGFAVFDFILSAPLYLVVSNDWDNPAAASFDSNLVLGESLHVAHPGLLITHFAGPYAFTDQTIPEQRKEWLASWLVRMREEYGDEIGLHIHPYCSFVAAAGLECITSPAWAASSPDGYAVGCYQYIEDQFVTLLQTADSIFQARGLGKPTSFRAGGWTTGLHTMKALARSGYVADGSGVNWGQAEELAGAPLLYDWIRLNWANVNDTTQPYYPSQENMMRAGVSYIPVLEVPDNGVLADYVDSTEMIDIFRRNWPGGALMEPRQYSIGYHPDGFGTYHNNARLQAALAYIDDYLAEDDRGPVVYARMSDLSRVWRP